MISDHVIELLDHDDKAAALCIWTLFQESYRAEAKLLGVENFPPLARTVESIKCSDSVFFCCRSDDHSIAGIVEVENGLDRVSISSLVVRPELFRHGIASKLVRHVLRLAKQKNVMVQTAELNTPAISLYKKFGFVERQSWQSAEGINLIRLEKDNAHEHMVQD